MRQHAKRYMAVKGACPSCSPHRLSYSLFPTLAMPTSRMQPMAEDETKLELMSEGTQSVAAHEDSNPRKGRILTRSVLRRHLPVAFCMLLHLMFFLSFLIITVIQRQPEHTVRYATRNWASEAFFGTFGVQGLNAIVKVRLLARHTTRATTDQADRDGFWCSHSSRRLSPSSSCSISSRALLQSTTNTQHGWGFCPL